MGIELPGELRGVAERTGTHWPEADEDAMREAASAWRRAADSLDGLAASSDNSANGALAAVEGEAGRAANRQWRGFVEPDTGKLPGCARECRAAAERLDHAAEQVGAAKVRIVRELVALAKQTDAAERAAGAGNPTAAVRAESAVSGTATNIAELNRALVSAVDSSGGVGIDSGAPPGAGPLVGSGGAPGAVMALGDSGDVVDPARVVDSPMDSPASVPPGATERVADPPDPAELAGAADDAGRIGRFAGEPTASAADLPGEVPEAPGAQEAQGLQGVQGVQGDRSPGGRISELLDPATAGAEDRGPTAAPEEAGNPPGGLPSGGAPDRELTGPVSPETLRRAGAAPDTGAEAGTGPIPAVDPVAPPVAESAVREAGVGGQRVEAEHDPSTAPHSVQRAWAAPGAASAPPPPQAPPGAPVPGQAGAAPPNPAPPPGQFGSQGQPGSPGQPQRPVPGAAPPPAPPGGGRPIGQPGQEAGAARPGVPPRAGHQFTGAAHPGAVPQAGRAPLTPGGGMSQQPQQPAQQPAEGRRPARENQRDPAVVAFVLHQFPLGHMPVAETRPSRQWSPSGQPSERDTFTVPPQSHPRADLVEELDGPGFACQPAPGTALCSVAEPDRAIPGELLVGYEPLGPEADVGEFEWERRYLLPGPGENGTHAYDWPVRHGFPDNGAEEPRPEIMPPDTLLDRLGDEWGLVLAPAGTCFANRSLPPEFRERPYRRYRVVRPLPVWHTRAVAWFEQPGTGLRYRTTHPITELVALGVLVDPDTESEQDTDSENVTESEPDSAPSDLVAEPDETEQTVRIRSNDMSSADDPAGAMR
ncbi:glycohydrolase toxin TNT-related protein [Actinopolyspora xinjiangensis]|uniref:glycohydrolase toxin TNT-related protein n=1 Tax=Actinopolyspora xinjiangensis TaxID=405564 RepID=UPI001113FBC1|nr:glycohydrolase toxin TNT-related protein [Actinopolyspora xinjiangensis]